MRGVGDFLKSDGSPWWLSVQRGGRNVGTRKIGNHDNGIPKS
jgi:hypothetical protein